MLPPVLLTKLYIPPSPPKVIVRTRLIERLNEGLSTGSKLTLISAPVGFGKTTLVIEWVAHYDRPVAWLSLDEGDSDPTRFLTYFVAALRMVAPNIGEGVLSALHASQSQPPPIDTILTALLNEITSFLEDSLTRPGGESEPGFILVLDDYHMIDATPIDEALSFLVEHLPPQMHLVYFTSYPAGHVPRYCKRDFITS